MNTKIKFFALVLAMAMLFTACASVGEDGTSAPTDSETLESVSEESASQESESSENTAQTESEGSESTSESESESEEETVPYRESISRSREEMEAMLTITDEIFDTVKTQLSAFEELALVSEDFDAVDALYNAFEDTYYYISSQVSISNIIYYLDMSITEASDRYQDLFDKYTAIYDLYAESCKKIYNSSPIRDQLFEDWTEEEIKEMLSYDPVTMELTRENEAILIELNDLPDNEFYDRSAELYARLVTNNNRLAELAGYDSYYEYASKEIYGRDYSVTEVESFSKLVQDYYIPAVEDLYNQYQQKFGSLKPIQSVATRNFLEGPFDKQSSNYLEAYINSFEGSMKEGMEHIFNNRNMIFTNAKNSHPSAFQVYLKDPGMPFCLFGSNGQSTPTMVHEIGHYYASLHNDDLSNYDLAETQSQGNEMLLLEFMKGQLPKNVYEAVKSYNMYLFAVQSIACVIIDEFEREVYALDSVEGFTSKDFDAIMDKVCENYGGISFVINNVTNMYNYWRQVATNNAVYYISYAVSMTEALNIFAEVSADRATGREIYRILIEDVTEEDKFLGAIEKAGLSSPFEKETFESILAIIKRK